MIPIAAMGVGVISHLSAFLHLRKAWKKGRDSVSETASVKASSTISSSSDAPVILKAENLKQAILVQIQTWKGANPLGDDTAETLENYVRQIRELSAIEHDLSAVIDTIRIDELEAERLELLAKADKTTSTTLKEEYIRSVEEISKQKRSALDLGEQQEILNLRIGSALKGLQQMQIDLARIKSLSDGQKQTYTSALKAQSEELSRYLEDYRSGLEESGLEDFDTTSLTPASPKV